MKCSTEVSGMWWQEGDGTSQREGATKEGTHKFFILTLPKWLADVRTGCVVMPKSMAKSKAGTERKNYDRYKFAVSVQLN